MWEFTEAFFVWTAAEVTLIWNITNENFKKYNYNSWKKDSITQQIKQIYSILVL